MVRLTLAIPDGSPACSVSEKTLPLEIDLRLSLASLLTVGSRLRSLISCSRVFTFSFLSLSLELLEACLQAFNILLFRMIFSSSLTILIEISPDLIPWIVYSLISLSV